MSRGPSALAALATILLTGFIGGCGGSDPVPPVVFPPRPVAVDVTAVPPCAVFSVEQRQQLGIVASQPGDAVVDGLTSPGCGYLSSPPFDYNSQTIPVSAVVAARLPGSEIVVVNGFGAVRNRPADSLGSRPICQVSVDAAPDQTVRIQVAITPGAPPVNTDELCRRATDVASMAMATIVATASR